jgi:uncharacterized membrane protein YqjE
LKLFDIDRLLDTLSGYLETKLEIFKLDLKEELATTLSKVIIYVIIGLLAIIALTFGLLALAAFLNDYLESSYLGYLINVAILILFGSVLYFNKNKIGQSIWERIEKADQVLNTEDEK